MSIRADDVPAAVKKDNNITPFISRAAELHSVHPVVSYYCKVYVLEHILTNKLHTTDKEVEAFTIRLLDETELIKNSEEDEDLHKILTDRQLSLNVVFAFVFKLFLSSLEDISNYNGLNKIQLASKLRASINFMTCLKVFTSDGDDSLNFSDTTGGSCKDKTEFSTFIKEKLKVLKYQLSRLIKDEIPLKGEEEALAKLEEEAKEEDEAQENQDKEDGDDELVPSEENSKADEPSRAKSPAKPEASGTDTPENPFNFPGAPKYDPTSETNTDDDEVKLPGAPKFLPDDDVTKINKDSTITVFPPGEPAERKENEKRPELPAKRTSSTTTVKHHEPITKENLKTILDTGEQITQAQKHAKFAISALNYEDIETAEKELLKGLDILRILKDQA